MEFYLHKNQDTQLLEMAEIGRFTDYKIMIYGGEGPIPHFHFERLDKKKNGCIRIDKPEYFPHGKHQDRFNSKEVKNLIKFLNTLHKTFGKVGYNNWQIICIYWDDNNVNYKLPEDLEMPDYSQLVNDRG